MCWTALDVVWDLQHVEKTCGDMESLESPVVEGDFTRLYAHAAWGDVVPAASVEDGGKDR
jgi:hypothetical protein